MSIGCLRLYQCCTILHWNYTTLPAGYSHNALNSDFSHTKPAMKLNHLQPDTYT